MGMREKYESLSKSALKDLAEYRGIDTTGMLKKDLVEAMVELDEREAAKGAAAEEKAKEEATKKVKTVSRASKEVTEDKPVKSAPRNEESEENAKITPGRYEPPRKPGQVKLTEDEKQFDVRIRASIPDETIAMDSGELVAGILEVTDNGYGFIRSANFLPGEDDVYVATGMIRKYHLKTGDYLKGSKKAREKDENDNYKEKFSALLYVISVNGEAPERATTRRPFEDLTPIFPQERIHLEYPGCTIAQRIVDIIAPIGKGQRGMIVSPPKAGKTTLLKQVATSVLKNNPEMHLIILLIDERPEEVTDIREAICGPQVEVIYSTFDELPDHHKRVAEMVLERGKRLVEHGQDVIVLLDSITRLARAYNLTVPPSGRTLTGGLDPAALHMPKKFFGAARKMREGGSLTVLATALVDTGSKMDDVVFEEFKGTGNMELVLDRKLQEKRIFPAVDIVKSGTRRDDLLLSADEQQAMEIARRGLNGAKPELATETLLRMFQGTRTNRDLVSEINRKRIL